MVEGIELFRDAMADYADNYIIIGGTACNIILDGSPMPPRPTRDIDLIVVVEKISREFVETFWKFVRDGGYEPAKRTSVCGEQVYALYRFVAPKQAGYFIIAEIVNILVDERYLVEDGKPALEKMHLISYDPVHHGYLELGGRVGNAFSDGKKLK